MLLNVHIKNIALIDDANVNFTDNLNILTGETGAGKSIIMGALKIGMGDKLPKDIVREQGKEGFCQLLFLVDDDQTADQIRELGVNPSEDGEILITRRIVGSRTINTINDMAVTASKLRGVSTSHRYAYSASAADTYEESGAHKDPRQIWQGDYRPG